MVFVQIRSFFNDANEKQAAVGPPVATPNDYDNWDEATDI